MTGEECKIALAQDVWRTQLADVHKELLEGAKARQAEQQAVLKVFEGAAKKIKERQKVALREEKDLKKAEDVAQRQRDKEDAKTRKDEETTHKRELKEHDARVKKKAAEEERARKVVEKAEKAQRKAMEEAAKQRAPQLPKRKAAAIEADTPLTDDGDSENRPSTPKCPRPHPHPPH